MRARTLIPILIAIIGCSVVAFLHFPPPSTPSISIESPRVIEVETPPISNTYKIPALSGTVLEAMNAYAENDEFSFSGRDFPGLGFFVEEINGRKNADGFYWTLFINNELSVKGATQTEISPADSVEWRYQKGI